MLKYVVGLCRECDGCCVFCLYCEGLISRCSCMGSVSVSSCIRCMFVSCVSTCQKNGKSGHHCWGWEGSTQIAQQLESAITAPPLVGCVIWSLFFTFICSKFADKIGFIFHDCLSVVNSS